MTTFDEQISAGETWLAVRLSSFKDLTYDNIKKVLEEKFIKYIMSEEGDNEDKKYHIHILLVTELSTDDVRDYFKEKFPDCKGNKCIYVRPSRDKKQLAKYTVKEGKFCYKGFSKKFIENMVKTASPKTNLNKEVVENEDKYMLGQIELREFLEEYLKIKARHNQPLYLNHIEAYARRVKLKKDPGYAKEVATLILTKINEY